MNLVIVESPAKGKTIEKYLGSQYKVLASFGHVRDLPKKELGVDTKGDFEPKYVIPPKARKVIKALKDAILKADKVYLATDYDREGEAIAWHVAQATGLLEKSQLPISKSQTNSNSKIIKSEKPIANSQKLKANRITFTEITKTALQKAVANPREIDLHLVDAQQARRVLDRLVGYKLSPFLWKKVYKGLSAGRVQSVAVRLIVDREREIEAFKPEEYWTVGANLAKDAIQFPAYLKEVDGKKFGKMDIKTQNQAQEIANDLDGANYKIENVEEKDVQRYPYPPFTTSTLQQEAARRLYFSAKQTMKLAQDLYEAGLITYMRTDSVNLSNESLENARKLIKSEYGDKYLPENARIFKTKSKGAQEAHEAIRPAHIEKTAEELDSKKFDDKHRKLYDLIRRRMLACQMSVAVLDTMSVTISSGKYILKANGSRVKFDGFLKVWQTAMEERFMPKLKTGDVADFVSMINEQHFTKPPARYSEASLVKALEEHGIGRPSTYAPIISTIQDRGYVLKDAGRFKPTQTAFIVTDLLVKNFPEIIDIEFTAGMEAKLDDVAENKLSYVKMLADFYGPFETNLEKKTKSVEKINTEEETDKKCPKCGKPIVIKMGKYGKFYACTGFPECKHTEPIKNTIGIKCPECEKGEIVERRTRRGKTFWGCDKYPKCKWASWNDPRKPQEGKPEILNSKSEINSNDQNLKRNNQTNSITEEN